MKRSLKLSLSALFLATIPLLNANAAQKNCDVCPFQVTIPKLSPGLQVDLTGLMFWPTASDLNYAVLTTPLPVPSPNWLVRSINPGFSTAFEIGASYTFPCSGKDVRADWLHFESSDASLTQNIDGTTFVAPFYEVGPDGEGITQGNANVKFRVDVINLNVGQFVNFGQNVQTRFFAGLSSARIRQDYSTTFQDNVASFVFNTESKSTFTGIGPSVGINSVYNIGCGVGFVAQAKGDLLVGTMQTSTQYNSNSTALSALGISTNLQSINAPNTMQVVPGFDAKLGLNYTYLPNKKSVLTLEGGYRVVDYISAINQFNPTTIVDPGTVQSGTIAVGTMGQTTSNFAMSGPYITVAYKI